MKTYPSPAKVNLFFRTLRKQRDGYHNIASLYTAISLCDYLSIDFSAKDCFSTNHDFLSMGEDNLVVKAVQLFRLKSGITDPVSLYLEKNIPMGAGLGGGSSNAATTLWAMNALFNNPLSIGQLIEVGKKIGSDVSFFFSLGAAYCVGRGEIFENVSLPDYFDNAWLAIPENIEVSTLLVYKECIPGEVSKEDPLDLMQKVNEGDRSAFVNDLEPASFRISPRLKEIKRKLLDATSEPVCMTGSGSSFFCLGEIISSSFKDVKFSKVEPVLRTSSVWYDLQNIEKTSILKGKKPKLCLPPNGKFI